MDQRPAHDTTVWLSPFSQQDWDQTPYTVHGPWGLPVLKAAVGWSASCRSAKRVAYRPSLPTPYWERP
jgi:hypothetical protein